MNLRFVFKYLYMIITFLLIDQVSKYLVKSYMSIGQTIAVIPNFFHITYVENPGAAFGMLAYKTPLFIGLSFVVILGIIYYLKKLESSNLLTRLAMGMLIAGALGNLIDRLQTGMVIDFIDFRGIWPFVFNIADVTICIGVGLLILELLRESKEGKLLDNNEEIDIKE